MEDLSRLPVGKTARVLALHAQGPIRRRLLDIGFTPGAVTHCLFAAPSGDPKAFWIRGAVIALREEDARQIESKEVFA